MNLEKNYTLSIVVPSYNASPYLKKCVESIYGEPFDERVYDVQVIIVNDGSKDNTIEIARELESAYSDIIVIEKPNEGQGSCIN